METLYTELEDAKVEIWQRWNDQELKRQVEEYLDNDIPDVFLREPRAVLFRNIASPDFEFLHFLNLAQQAGLKPLVLEFLDDQFSTRNADKLCLVKLAIFQKKNSKGEPIVRFKKIIDIKTNDNRRFLDIKTIHNKQLVDFHHDLIEQLVPGDVDIFDMSAWVRRNGKSAVDYYKKFLVLFVCHGILFENFVTNSSEAGFEQKVVVPAVDNTRSIFSKRPFVSPLASDPTDMHWWTYPHRVSDFLA